MNAMTQSAAIPLIGTHRNLRALVDYSAGFARQAKASGQRLLWAPAHALGGCVSLRTWILDQAVQALGENAPEETSLLLSGAADAIVIIDPASADAASLHWLTDLLSCSQEVADLAAMPPLPQLIVLATSRSTGEPAVAQFLEKLESLGAEDIRIAGTESGNGDIRRLLDRNDDLLAAVALAPVPLTLEDLNAVARASGKNTLPVSDLLDAGLLQVIGDLVVPAATDARKTLREALSPESLSRGAALLLPIVEARHESLPDARVELALRSGDGRRAAKLARRRYDEHVNANRLEEAMRLLELGRELQFPIEGGKYAAEIDEARIAWLAAQTGQFEKARSIVTRLAKNRGAYGQSEFVQHVALAGRELALKGQYDVRLADSLLRRAIRLVEGDLDAHVRLTLLRVELLASDVMKLEERSGWLLNHINGEILDELSPATLAQFLQDTALRMWQRDDVRGAMRRLRKLLVMELGDRRKSRAMLLMARCRLYVEDRDAAARFAQGALNHALRAADLALVKQSAAFVRELQQHQPRELPPIAAPGKGAKAFPRIPAMAQVQTAPVADVSNVFDVLQARFGVTGWVRRRGSEVQTHGKPGNPSTAVWAYQETDGRPARVAGSGESPGAVALARQEGSDIVFLQAGADFESRADSLLQLLLSDRDENRPAGPLRRADVIADYYRRALDHGTENGLHTTMEMLFNKDVLIYFEEQGIGKDEMARKLDVSRATLYRMYARSGLNI